MKMLLTRRTAGLALLTLVSASAVGAQTGGWFPPTIDMGPNLKGANRAAALARLERIERLLKQIPELAHPDGFEIKPYFTGIRSRTGLNASEHADYAVEYLYRL